MKAPWYLDMVNVKSPMGDYWIDIGDDETDLDIVRYLRADLKCSECGKMPLEEDGIFVNCSEGYMRENNYPACMEFQPKENK